MLYLSYESLDHFEHARRWAFFEQAWQWLNRRPRTLLCFDEIRALLGLNRMVYRGVEEIDLTRVIGSVTKQRDFTRAFRPSTTFNRDRWRHGLLVSVCGQ